MLNSPAWLFSFRLVLIVSISSVLPLAAAVRRLPLLDGATN